MSEKTRKTYHPRVQVIVQRNVYRVNGVASRAADKPAEIDLTPFLGDGSQVMTTKARHAPMGGFSITIPDHADPHTLDTLYASIEPMDHVVIRMAHAPHEYPDGLPVVMRGFVDRVHRSEIMATDGRPKRVINVVGNDYGIVFNNIQVFYAREHWTGKNMLNTMRLYLIYEAFAAPMPAAEFLREIIDHVVNPYLSTIEFSEWGANAQPIAVAATVSQGTVVSHAFRSHQGPIWELMEKQADRPWNELFIEDLEDGPCLVYRPTPFKCVEGKWIPQGDQQVGAETVEIGDEDLISINVERSQKGIANFFVVDAQLALFSGKVTSHYLEQGDDTVYTPDHANSDPLLYGDRRLRVTTVHGSTEFKTVPLHQQESAQKEIDSQFLSWLKERRRVLRDMNWDNALFESGTLSLRGNERIKIGRYLRLRRGEMRPEYYVDQVTHTFQPFRSFLTNVQVIRGTGFIERTKRATSPYYAEGRRNGFGR